MTAAYEIPVRLLRPVRTGIILAADLVTRDDGYHNGRSLVDLTDEWYADALLSSRHEELLKPADAASLLAVLEIAMKHVIDSNYEGAPGSRDGDNLMFALCVDEIRQALREIVYSDCLVFA